MDGWTPEWEWTGRAWTPAGAFKQQIAALEPRLEDCEDRESYEERRAGLRRRVQMSVPRGATPPSK